MKRLDDLMDKGFRAELRNDLLKQGFIFFPGFLNPGEIGQVESKMEDFIGEKVEKMPEEQVYL